MPSSGQKTIRFDLVDTAHLNPETPASAWEQNAAKRALDELFTLTFQYSSSKAYHELMQFIADFRSYSPFNAMLAHVQMPGATFVAPPSRWLRDYGRRIKPGARPLVILQPMGPVMFVFDVSDTDGEPLPPEVERPFEIRHGQIGVELDRTIENSKRDGVAVHTAKLGSQQGGSIRTTNAPGRHIAFADVKLPVRYQIELDQDASRESRYAALVHELAHLYCGHLGTPNPQWWPDRRGLAHRAEEFEAESVAFLVCARAGIQNPSERYLATYVQTEAHVPSISLECIMKVAGLIENMGRNTLKPRKSKPA